MSDYSDRTFMSGELIGWRLFRTDDDANLYGPFVNKLWVPGVNHAECFRQVIMVTTVKPFTQSPIGAPTGPVIEAEAKTVQKCLGYLETKCNCGFYARTDQIPRHWYGRNMFENHVVAAVKGWGKIVAGSAGFRAEYAQVIGLYHNMGVDDNAIFDPILFIPPVRDSRILEQLTQRFDVPGYRIVAEFARDFPATPIAADE